LFRYTVAAAAADAADDDGGNSDVTVTAQWSAEKVGQRRKSASFVGEFPGVEAGKQYLVSMEVRVSVNRNWRDDVSFGGEGDVMKTCGNVDWEQCGGKEFIGATCCPAGSACAYTNEWWSQCTPGYEDGDDNTLESQRQPSSGAREVAIMEQQREEEDESSGRRRRRNRSLLQEQDASETAGGEADDKQAEYGGGGRAANAEEFSDAEDGMGLSLAYTRPRVYASSQLF
jgi:hypothetical protein